MTKKKPTKSKVDVYEMVTNRIIEQLEKGVVPWRKPWINTSPVNWKTGKPYRGINTLLLDRGEYATFKQITEAGGKVKKGESSHVIVFWKWLDAEDEDGETKKIPYLRYYRVFEINTQVDGLKSKRINEAFEHEPVEEAEKIVNGYINAPSYSFQSTSAYYSPSSDHINVPPMKDYPNIDEYYSTLFHEMVHSTGHGERLNREGVNRKAIAFGDEVYSKEELIAEMGAAMLCGISGIDNNTIENSASYINSWLRVLKEDSRLVVSAAGQAQKAADHIQGIKFED